MKDQETVGDSPAFVEMRGADRVGLKGPGGFPRVWGSRNCQSTPIGDYRTLYRTRRTVFNDYMREIMHLRVRYLNPGLGELKAKVTT